MQVSQVGDPRGLEPQTKRAVQVLVNQGFSIRKTASLLGLSRGNVETALKGKHVTPPLGLSRKDAESRLDQIIDRASERLLETLENQKKLTPQVLNSILSHTWSRRYKDTEPVRSQNVIFNLFGSVHPKLMKSLNRLPEPVQQLLAEAQEEKPLPEELDQGTAENVR